MFCVRFKHRLEFHPFWWRARNNCTKSGHYTAEMSEIPTLHTGLQTGRTVFIHADWVASFAGDRRNNNIQRDTVNVFIHLVPESSLSHRCCRMRIEAVKSSRLDKGPDKRPREPSDSSRLTNTPVPEEMPVLVTGSLHRMRYLWLSFCPYASWRERERERVCMYIIYIYNWRLRDLPRYTKGRFSPLF